MLTQTSFLNSEHTVYTMLCSTTLYVSLFIHKMLENYEERTVHDYILSIAYIFDDSYFMAAVFIASTAG